MDWCSVYLTPQALPKYIYFSPPLIFPTTSTELGQETARYESHQALLYYVECDRIVTLSKHKRTLSYLQGTLIDTSWLLIYFTILWAFYLFE